MAVAPCSVEKGHFIILRKLLRWSVFLVAVGAAVLLIAYSYIPARTARKEIEAEVAGLEQEVAKSEREKERLVHAREELEREGSFYLEKRARQKLNYMRPGETIYRVRSSEQTGGADGPSRLP